MIQDRFVPIEADSAITGLAWRGIILSSPHIVNCGQHDDGVSMRVLQSAWGDSLRTRISKALNHFWYLPPDEPRVRKVSSCFRMSSTIYRLLCQDQQKRCGALQHRQHLPVPVISVGNLVVGGTGKTPMSMWLANHFKAFCGSLAVLSRGYARGSKEVSRVVIGSDPRDASRLYGDEPVLMAARLAGAAVWVGRRRSLCGRAAIEQNGAQLLILDDGYQHWGLHRDLDLVLVDAGRPWGNGCLLPLGPMREPIEHLARAHAIIVTRVQNDSKSLGLCQELRRRFPGKPVFTCRYRLTGARWGLVGPNAPLEVLSKQPAVVFAGIARPESFFQMVQNLGVQSVLNLSLADHHPFRQEDFKRIMAPVLAGEARWLITTEKDAVRLPNVLRELVVTLAVEVDFGEDSGLFVDFLGQWWNQMNELIQLS